MDASLSTSSKLYKAGPLRKVEGRNGMVYEEEDCRNRLAGVIKHLDSILLYCI